MHRKTSNFSIQTIVLLHDPIQNTTRGIFVIIISAFNNLVLFILVVFKPLVRGQKVL
jgi:hypothetical protein